MRISDVQDVIACKRLVSKIAAGLTTTRLTGDNTAVGLPRIAALVVDGSVRIPRVAFGMTVPILRDRA